MAKRGRKVYTTSHARKTSKRVRESTVGTHVAHGGKASRRSGGFAESIRRRAHIRRIITGIAAVVIVLAVGFGAAWFAFRSVVGSEMALRDSNASEALVAAKSGDPVYTLVTVELGATAEPLEISGPEMMFLARIDDDDRSIALINIPATLQVTMDNSSISMASTATNGDAALIEAFATYAKIDVNHLVKISQDDLLGLVDALGGIDVDIDQVIDDPRAGTVYMPEGQTKLDSSNVLVYLRADNLKLGQQDKMTHQLEFAKSLIAELFMSGAYQTKLDSIGSFVQTDCSYGDIEKTAGWLGILTVDDIQAITLPGYQTTATGVLDGDEERYICPSSDFAEIIEALDNGEQVSSSASSSGDSASPSSFTVDVQNGTAIAGAAAVTGDLLASKGFTVGSVGNAEQQVYEETLVVYKEGGLANANAVIDAVGVGRAVDVSEYYKFDGDVLIVIGNDYKPVS